MNGTATLGLTSTEAARRLGEVGANRLVEPSRLSALRGLLHALGDPMALMLAVTGAVYLAFGEIVDGVVLLIALIPVLGVDVLLESRSKKALDALRDALAPTARVIRDGDERTIASDDLVPGDAMLLREGDVLHADAVVVRGDNLSTDESHLTGESEPQAKAPGAPLHAGSRVLGGRGVATVTATGARTTYGALARQVADAAPGETPLGRRVSRLARRLGAGALVAAAIVFAIRVGSGVAPAAAFLTAISFAMAAMPEEFPLVFTLFLSLGALRLGRRGVLVRRLVGVEALGSTTVICTDKTGTLTHGRFELDAHVALGGAGGGPSDDALLEAAALASEPEPDDAMERAIARHCAGHGIDMAALHATWRLAADHPFEREGKHLTHVWEDHGRWCVVMKGAVEGVLAHCADAAAAHAAAAPAMADLARQGMRVLAVARRDGAGPLPATRDDAEVGLTLMGLIGFRDPLRAEVPEAIAACRTAGIRVKVVTGDHALTARTVAEAAGLAVADDGGVVTGPELDLLDDAARAARIERATVLARIRPDQKYDIVDRLTRAGEVVAMTGDGINDAPALRRASIGVSMGAGATEVARGAAGLVLMHSDFGHLVDTVREGRRIFANLQRAFLFLVGFHVPIVGLAVLAPALGLPLLFAPIHLVWLELIIHPVSALVFEDEPADADIMRRPPRGPDEPILPRPLLLRALASGVLVTLGALAIYAARQGAGVDAARAAALTAVIAGGLGLVWAERALERPWWRVPLPRRRRFWIVLALVAASVPLAIFVPPVARVLALAPPRAADLGLALAVALAAVAWRARGLRARAA